MLELSAATRRDHLERMAEADLDVLVVGGGIVGAGAALDAASRGLLVALVERDDFASGTSGRSSRLIHGGIRYLRHGEVGLVAESLRERRALLRRAPHLVQPIPFLMPVRRLAHRVPFRTGLTMYDLLAARHNIAPHRRVDETEVGRLAPGLRRRSPGYVYWDCRTDDARLVIEVVREAARRGALVANRVEVAELIGDGTVRGARITDRASGGTFEARARVTVNATGVWAAELHGQGRGSSPRLRPSKGTHLVFDRARIPIRCTVLVPSLAGHGGLFFLVPWGPRVYMGTTDTAYEGPLGSPVTDADDLALLLGSVNRAFALELSPQDVLATWAGVRPLLDAGPRATRDLSRRHVVLAGTPGLVTVTGGKLTTFRAMAEQVTDIACHQLGRGGACVTARLPLGLTASFEGEAEAAERAAARLALPAGAGRRLVERYGDDWRAALERIREEPELGNPAHDGLPVLRVELELARSREMALDEDDVDVRRTRLALMGRPGPGR